MPLIYSPESSPTIRSIGEKNTLIAISSEQAEFAKIRPLRIGLINNMPDAAFKSTERQFLSLLGSESILQIKPYLLTCSGIPRNKEISEYIQNHYTSFGEIQKTGLDGLIISGANFGDDPIETLPFYDELVSIIQWSNRNVISTLTSCLATHVVMKCQHDINRILQAKKIWGVFEHQVTDNTHPLVSNMNSDIMIPHSRWNDIREEDFIKTGHQILIKSKTAGVNLAVSNNFRWVMLQGHPEYDTVSLAREYLRDKKNRKTQEPINYINPILRSLDTDKNYSNQELEEIGIKNNWQDNANILLSRWIAIIYRLTDFREPGKYMSGINEDNPLDFFLHQKQI